MVNTIASHDDGTYHQRWIAPLLRVVSAAEPVVVLTGPRQSGKTTLLRNEEPFRSWRYVTLDDYDAQTLAREAPAELFAGAQGVVIDEVQRVPELLLGVKRSVDEGRGIRFALSGSANLLLMKQVSESLAGRAAYLELGPFSLGELMGRSAPRVLHDLLDGQLPEEGRLDAGTHDPWGLLVQGLLPPVALRDSDRARGWWDSYVHTYLERDLRQLSQVEALSDFRRLMEAVALRSGSLVNQSEIARDVGLSQATAHRYISLLEMGMLLTRLPAYAVNRTSRISKAPKLHYADPGLTAFLCGHYSSADARDSRESGAIWESAMLAQVVALAALVEPRPRLYHWRARGLEVDLVLEHGRRLVAFEIKATREPRQAHAQGLRKFMQLYPETVGGVVIHGGDEVRRLGEKIVAIPWSLLAGV